MNYIHIKYKEIGDFLILIYIYIYFWDRSFHNRVFCNVAYKIKPQIFKIFYAIINKYINNNYFKKK